MHRRVQRQLVVLGPSFQNKPDRSFTQLFRILPRCWYDSTFSWDRCLHKTRGTSPFLVVGVPGGVVSGGGDGVVADGDVDEGFVAGAGVGGGDLSWSGFAGDRVGGPDPVADFELVDVFGGAV